MILHDFLRALRQIGDRPFRRVLGLGALLSAALLAGVYALFLWGVRTLTPDTVEIPFVGPVAGLDTLLSWGSVLFAIGLSVFLMVPVAAAFSGLFLDDVVRAVEARHYPDLPPVPRQPVYEGLVDAANLFAVLVALNLLALLVYPFTGPAAPLLFWGLNGYLLGREYFMLVAMRRLGRADAGDLRRRHRGTIWLAGALMAAPLSVPLVNLLVPVLGAATFTHLFHRLHRSAPP